ncbi:N-acetyl-alpha-D-glucosaminyl L-malate synthase BshA [Flammeovirga agarivorans]|uniref:N-acetyl-alpha-D-glucosaminyl L-malate synthase BshA n=1 Tax=Flammeovirga agarivorans TaxID=2726742 RepID=A0A7X8SMI7_9BACT|nr:N-acetyl-alpha-D-glucosaminyl L-malate synthase BshA [Flammeovirga agarivorans]NLR92979.1 N-acetyl-alpha-D-glucosaminyl L-malate synthase BshA [Flammeovirga agarivorans]
MKIGIICYPTYGGSGVVATELGKNLASKLGHEVHFITYDQPTRLDFFDENIFYHKVDIRTYPLFKYPPYELALTSKMVEVALAEKLDVLHAHYAIPHASAAYTAKQILAKKGIDMPVVTTLHGTDVTLVGKDDSFEPVVAFSIDESDCVTSVSESLKKETYEYFDLTKDIKVIPNFVDLDRFTKHKKDHFKTAICPNGEKLLVHVSNMREVKRADDALEVFKRVREKIPCKLLMVGDGPERAKLEEKCAELRTCADVRFLGKIAEVEEILSVADLYLMPSEKESFGLAALEAMACQVPVVSSNAGGIPEVNIHGLTGMMSEVGDVDDMAKNALHILDDANLPYYKENALKQAQQFSIEKVCPLYEDIYKEAIAKSKEKFQLKA